MLLMLFGLVLISAVGFASAETTDEFFGCKGDVNNDGLVNNGDIDPFNTVYNNATFYQLNYPDMFWRADVVSDDVLNSNDIDQFVSLVTGQTLADCNLPPVIPEFGFYVGALTLMGAVGVFFLVRRK